MSDIEIVNPTGWAAPIGYSNAVAAGPGRVLYLGGQVAFDETGHLVDAELGDLVAQFRRTLANLQTVCEAAGTTARSIVKLTIFVADRDDYRAHGRALGAAYREVFGDHYPAMTLVEISRFYEEGVLIEIEGIAAL